jgi:molybdopterin synthase sulfur carrier subunit
MKLVYFASIREQLGCDEEQLALPQGVTTVSDLVDWLASARGEPWARVLRDSRLLCAVNQEMAALDSVIADGDEVAFFPPVTGG